jgi:FMN phosphatase YigB (HAD superfamily)
MKSFKVLVMTCAVSAIITSSAEEIGKKIQGVGKKIKQEIHHIGDSLSHNKDHLIDNIRNTTTPTPIAKNGIVIAFDSDCLLHSAQSKVSAIWDAPVSFEAKTRYVGLRIRTYNRKTEEILHYIEDNYADQPMLCSELKQLVVATHCSNQEVNPHMLALIKDLKAQGYVLHLLINNGRDTYELLEKQPQLHDLLHQFDLTNTQYIDFGHYPIIDKSNPHYFYDYLERIKGHHVITNNRQVFYVDSNAKYLDIAQDCGMRSIKFKDIKTLKKDLKKAYII